MRSRFRYTQSINPPDTRNFDRAEGIPAERAMTELQQPFDIPPRI